MPPKAKPAPTLTRVLIQHLDNRVGWVEYPSPGWFPSTTLAYGWSDGIVTWTENRD